jgi:hypothetical protein
MTTPRTASRIAALSLAVVVTLSVLAGIDGLARSDATVPQLAQQQTAAPQG